MRNRSTLNGGDKTPRTRPTGYLDRPSITNSGMKAGGSQDRNIVSVEQLTESILNCEKIMGMSHVGLDPTQLVKIIKNDQKTVLTLIGNFLGVLDHKEHVKVDIEMIPEIFKALGCPYNVNKNIFNPVGAKHTWGSCLMIINWLAQLACYFYKSKDKIMEKVQVDWNLQNLYIDAYKNKKKVDESQLIGYYDNKIAGLKVEYESYIKEQNDIQLAVNSVESGQRSIEEVQEELKKIEIEEAREIHEVTIIQNQTKEKERLIYQEGVELKELQLKLNEIKLENKKVERQIQSQTSTVEDVQKMIDEIAELENIRVELDNDLKKKKDEYTKEAENLIYQFTREKTKFDFRNEHIKRSNIALNQSLANDLGMFQEFPVNFQALKEYLMTPVPANSPIINEIFVYNCHEKISQMKQACSKVAGMIMSQSDDIEASKKTVAELNTKNQELHRELNELKLKIEKKTNSNLMMKQEIQNLGRKMVLLNSETTSLQMISNERQKTFSDLMFKIQQSKKQQIMINEKIQEVKANGQRMVAKSIQDTKITVKNIDKHLQTVHQNIKTFNKEYYNISKRRRLIGEDDLDNQKEEQVPEGVNRNRNINNNENQHSNLDGNRNSNK